MANITLRLVKGSPLTNAEVDNNFSNLNISKIEIGGDISGNITIPIISGIQGRSISNIAPSNRQALVWVSSNNKWEPGNVAEDAGTVNYADLENKPSVNVTIAGYITGSSNLSLAANTNILSIATTRSNAEFYFTDTPPSSPQVGDRWVHSETGVLYTYIDDGNSTQWVNVTGYAASPTPAPTVEVLSPFLLMGA